MKNHSIPQKSAFNREPYISEYEGVFGSEFDVSRYYSAEGRLAEFNYLHPDGRIATSVHALTNKYVFVLCEVFVLRTDTKPTAQGLGVALRQDLEEAREQTIGRALIDFGIAAEEFPFLSCVDEAGDGQLAERLLASEFGAEDKAAG